MLPEREPNPEREPTRDELLAMAYSDGELRDHDLDEFQTRLASEPNLAREVSEYRALQLLALQMAPPEPADYEWDRLRSDPVHLAAERLGWLLFVGAAFGLGGYGVYWAAFSDMAPFPKGLLLAAITGFTLLLLSTVRARLRLIPYDPYRRVQR